MLNEYNCLNCAEYNAKLHGNLQERSQTNNSNMETKTFDLNDADVIEENGYWVFRFPGRPETISISVIKMEDFVKGTQKTTFHYDDGKPACELVKIDIGKTEIRVECRDEILVFKNQNEAISRLMMKPEEFSIRFGDENDNPVKEMHADTISETLEGVRGLIENVAKLLGLPKPKVEVRFNGCVGDMTFFVSYPKVVECLKK